MLGLSVGTAVFLILLQYTQRELKSDQFAKDYQRIYRLVSKLDFTYDGEDFSSQLSVYNPWSAQEVTKSAPQIEAFTRILNQHGFGPVWIANAKSVN